MSASMHTMHREPPGRRVADVRTACTWPRALLAGALLAGAVVAGLPTLARAQSELFGLAPRATVPNLAGAVHAVAVAGRAGVAVLGTASGTVLLAGLERGEVRQRWSVRGTVEALAITRDERLLAIGTSDGEVALLDLARGALTPVTRGAPVRALAFAPDGNTLAVGQRTGEVALWTTGTPQLIGRLRDVHRKAIRRLDWIGATGASLLTIGEDRRLVWWDVKQLRPVREALDVDQSLQVAAFNSNAALVVVGTETFQRSYPGQPNVYRNQLRIYQTESGGVEKVLDALGRAPEALAVSPDQRYLASALRDTHGTSLVVWDLARGVSILDQPQEGRVRALAFARTGKALVVATERATVLHEVTGVTPGLYIAGGLRGEKYGITSPREPLVASDRRTRVAVLHVDDNGVGPEIARAIAEQLDNVLAANPAVRLVERRRIDAILGEQAFQRSGRTDPATAVQLARILNVDQVLLGAISRLGTRIDITVRAVDVETAAIDGVRAVKCEACALEELGEAVGLLGEVLVRPPSPQDAAYPAPPRIEIDYPQDDGEVEGDSVTVRARIAYSGALEGIELVANGDALDAARLLPPRAGRRTPLAAGRSTVTIAQVVPLRAARTVIAVRAIGADGNDEQRYLTVRRRAGRAPAAPTLGITLEELLSALGQRVPSARLAALVEQYGLAFHLDVSARGALTQAGADARVVTACERARVVAPDGAAAR